MWEEGGGKGEGGGRKRNNKIINSLGALMWEEGAGKGGGRREGEEQ